MSEEVRVCKNKNCKKILPAGYKYGYCEACRNQQAQKAKDLFKNAGIGFLAAVGVFLVSKIRDKD